MGSIEEDGLWDCTWFVFKIKRASDEQRFPMKMVYLQTIDLEFFWSLETSVLGQEETEKEML